MQIHLRENDQIGPDTPERVSPPATLPSLLEKGLKLVGLSDAGRGYFMHRPRPRFEHLLITVAGLGRVLVDNQWIKCGEGSAYVSPANVPSAFETLPHQRWQFAWVFFEESGGRHAGLFGSGRSTVVPAAGNLLASTVEGFYREGIGRAKKPLLDNWAQLIHDYCDLILEPSAPQDVDPLAGLWIDVDTRLAAKWSIAKLADHAGVSSETLRKLSVAHHGRSPMQQVAHLRMRRAEMLMKSTPAKLASVARMVGYENAFAFSSAFKRIRGTPPSSCRQK